jgi:hypothetical protein
MKIFDRVKSTIHQNKLTVESGGYNAIPWELPKLSTILPGIQRAKYQIVTANSKVGKTQLADFLFLHQPYEFYLKHPEANIKPRIFYFSLEMSKESKILSVISYKLFKDHRISKSPEELLSVFRDKAVDDKLYDLIKSYDSFFEDFESRVTFMDHIRNPFGIFKYMEEYALSIGHWEFKDIDWEENGVKTTKKVRDYYVPNDPEELVIIIVDHASLLFPEKQQTLHEAMSKFSSDYCLYLRDKYKYNITVVQQQAAAQEQKQFSGLSGENIIEKLKPTADGLGDNKLTGRDCNLLIGLFTPFRYSKKPIYEGYDLSILRDNYRELSVLLNRDGKSNAVVDLYFDGASNFFQELPDPTDITEIKKVYEYCKNKSK